MTRGRGSSPAGRPFDRAVPYDRAPRRYSPTTGLGRRRKWITLSRCRETRRVTQVWTDGSRLPSDPDGRELSPQTPDTGLYRSGPSVGWTLGEIMDPTWTLRWVVSMRDLLYAVLGHHRQDATGFPQQHAGGFDASTNDAGRVPGTLLGGGVLSANGLNGQEKKRYGRRRNLALKPPKLRYGTKHAERIDIELQTQVCPNAAEHPMASVRLARDSPESVASS
ncbi:hypothetical protein VTN02DRAFT_1618 [Thermoascus thermophilus]